MESGARAGLGLGFGLAGLLAATLTYFAFDFGLFDGSKWSGATLAVAIGAGSAVVMLALDRALRRASGPKEGKRAKIRGPWGCPRCGAAYRPEARECSDCHVPLVEAE
jgi:hypothetical protein